MLKSLVLGKDKPMKKEIMNELENGVKAVFTSGKYAEYLNVMSRFHNYSFNNCMLIAYQCPERSLVAGFKAWQSKFERKVKKGEKAIKILRPYEYTAKVEEIDKATGETVEVDKKFKSFRFVNVFDISQTDGKDLPTYCEDLIGEVEDFKGLIKKLKKVSPVKVKMAEINNGSHGYYSHDTNDITIKKGMSELQTIKTLIHEIAHAILHNRKDGLDIEADRSTKEVQAESVAYVVSRQLGLDTSSYSFEYIAGWAKDKTLKQLSGSMDVIRKASDTIIAGLTA